MTLSIIELGALGEFVGSFLVLLTLVYLTIQLRQNTKMIRSTMQNSIASARIDASKILVDPHVAEVVSPLSVAESGFPAPGTPDASVVYGYVMTWLQGYEGQYVQAEDGLLEADTLHRRMRLFSAVPLHRHMWREWQLGNWFSVGFAKLMDGFMDEAEEAARNYGLAVEAGQDVYANSHGEAN